MSNEKLIINRITWNKLRSSLSTNDMKRVLMIIREVPKKTNLTTSVFKSYDICKDSLSDKYKSNESIKQSSQQFLGTNKILEVFPKPRSKAFTNHFKRSYNSYLKINEFQNEQISTEKNSNFINHQIYTLKKNIDKNNLIIKRLRENKIKLEKEFLNSPK